MSGYVLIDIVAVMVLGGVMAWGVIEHRRWRKRHPLPGRPSEAEIQRERERQHTRP
ncbi:MAG TPA: hypothetical protein VEC14_12710 [Reyranellaceae bacterium]|nr:hypothetical protein [Reyranellaceae bacterium]